MCDANCDCFVELARRRALPCGGRPRDRGRDRPGGRGKDGCSTFLAFLKAIGLLGLMMWILKLIFYKGHTGSTGFGHHGAGAMKDRNRTSGGGAGRGVKDGRQSCDCTPCPIPPPKKFKC